MCIRITCFHARFIQSAVPAPVGNQILDDDADAGTFSGGTFTGKGAVEPWVGVVLAECGAFTSAGIRHWRREIWRNGRPCVDGFVHQHINKNGADVN